MMVILGLGSNLGDRLSHLRKAYLAIQTIPGLVVHQVSPIYISDALMPENAPNEWDMPYLNLALRCETMLEPLALLKELKTIEWTIGRKPEIRHWGPRIIDIDILAWEQTVIESDMLTVPHLSLQERPFALWPLADVAPTWQFPLRGPSQGQTAAQMVESWGSRFSGDAPFHTRQIQQRIDTPQLVGIVNITPDSFSDGGQFFSPEKALQQIADLIKAGAEVIDIGAESTAPQAQPLNASDEWARLGPIIQSLRDIKKLSLIPPKISLDTRHSEIAMKALTMDVDWINDVSGLDDADMRNILAQSSADCVMMHHLAIPERRTHVLPRNQDPLKLVFDWAKSRIQLLETQGIPRERIIFDPGIGFGKMAEQSLLLIKHIQLFTTLGVRILVGHSRKTFLSLFTDMPFAERDIETTAMSIFLSNQPVDYLRVHNVDMCARAFKVISGLK